MDTERKNGRERTMKRKAKPQWVMTKAGERVEWAYFQGTAKEVTLTDIREDACPFCGVVAITGLPPRLMAEQTDGTTHLCHPVLGGCNHGFSATEGAWRG